MHGLTLFWERNAGVRELVVDLRGLLGICRRSLDSRS